MTLTDSDVLYWPSMPIMQARDPQTERLSCASSMHLSAGQTLPRQATLQTQQLAKFQKKCEISPRVTEINPVTLLQSGASSCPRPGLVGHAENVRCGDLGLRQTGPHEAHR